jgi:hypothetical protein
MKIRTLLFLSFWVIFGASCSRKTLAPAQPVSEAYSNVTETIPLSEINIPVRINLQPLYQLAEKYVDKEFTSEGWPDNWVYDRCNTRYMYHFKRGPLQLSFAGRKAEMDFTCYYKVKGSQRACVGGVGVTPWSPPCACGMNGEPERKIQIGFSADFFVKNDYSVGANITVKEPKTPDPCEVCFFRSDITSVIVKNIKPQLDTAKAMALQQIGHLSLKTQVQQLWNQLQQPISLGGYGYLNINPEQILLNRLSANNNNLDVSIGLTVRPLAGFENKTPGVTALPLLQGGVDTGGFKIYADARLNYDSLGKIINQQMAGTRIEFEKGLIKRKYIDIENVLLIPAGGNRVTLKVKVAGSVKGTVYLTGRPVFDAATETLSVESLEYDVSTRNLLLNTAAWMMDKKINKKLNDAARFELKEYLTLFRNKINTELNRNLGKGISTTGNINKLTVTDLLPQPGFFFIRMLAQGNMNVVVNELVF